jgi:hypothetical protein
MYEAGSASWRFGHGDKGYLRTALLVRDAVQLAIPAADDVPPPLKGNVPDLRDLVPPAERSEAGRQWVTWWRRLVGQAAREARRRWMAPPGDDFGAVIRRRFAGRDAVFDPPEFGSLAATQLLQSAVRAVFAMASQLPDEPGRGQAEFAWQLVRDVAERTAAEIGVPAADLTGNADVVTVEGLWWCLAGPGSAICSLDAACDPETSAAILREVFRSGLLRSASGPE